MRVKIEVVGSHVHLTQDDLEKLFGASYKLTQERELAHEIEFISTAKVTLVGLKEALPQIPVWGPSVSVTQIEVALTDSYRLGISAPMRLSGKIQCSGSITLVGPKGSISLKKGLIVPKRHLHINPEMARAWKLRDNQNVNISVDSERGVTFHKVEVRIQEGAKPVVHLDRNEGNAVWVLEMTDEGTVINNET